MKKVLSFLTNQRLVGLLFLLLSGLYIHFINDIYLDFWSESEPFNARTMPYLFGYGALACSLLLVLLPARPFEWSNLASLKYAPAACLLALLVFYSVAIDYLGFIVTSSVFLCAGFFVLGERNIFRNIATALGLSLLFYFGLSALDIYLSPGELWLSND